MMPTPATPLRQAARRAARDPAVVAGTILLTLLAVVALLAPWLAPNDPQAQDLLSTLLPPRWLSGSDARFPLGTDTLGRCTLSRLIFGGRVAIHVAVLAATGAMLLGTTLALVAGYFGGIVDRLVSRCIDVWMSFPPVVLAMILLVGLGAGVNKVVLAIVLIDWTRFTRVIRSEVLIVRRRDYITAARLAGASHIQVLWREVLPAILPLTITLLSIEMGIAVIVEAILSFVGLSVEPDVAAWGVLIADARQTMHQSPWGILFPVTAIFVTVLAFNLVGTGLRRSLDARLVTARVDATA